MIFHLLFFFFDGCCSRNSFSQQIEVDFSDKSRTIKGFGFSEEKQVVVAAHPCKFFN
jgi:hypothetical protein